MIANKLIEKDNYILPPIGLYDILEDDSSEETEYLKDIKNILQATLTRCHVDGQVICFTVGAQFTQFEIKLSPGVSMSRFIDIENDIAIEMDGRPIRILTYIQNRNTVGIEVPNKRSRIISIRSVLETTEWKNAEGTVSSIPIILGKDVSGNTVIINLVKSPHLLITGAMGSGISVFLNTLIISFLNKFSPHDLQLILIDTKQVEFSQYHSLPHLLTPIITDSKQISITLQWINHEIERRYSLLARTRKKNLQAFNMRQKSESSELDDDGNLIPERLPFLITIIDEMEGFMLTGRKREFENLLWQITHKGHTVGIYLIVATQALRKDVVTDIIKNSFQTKISFKVNSKQESQLVFETFGAEKLLGMGDMLFVESSSQILNRIQGAIVSDSEIQKVVDFLSPQVSQRFCHDGVNGFVAQREVCSGNCCETETSIRKDENELLSYITDAQVQRVVQKYHQPGDDDLISKAIVFVLHERRVSTSYLQRCLGIGYNKSLELIEKLEKRGIVSPPLPGGQKRDILILDELLDTTDVLFETSFSKKDDIQRFEKIDTTPQDQLTNILHENIPEKEDESNEKKFSEEVFNAEKQKEIESKIQVAADMLSIKYVEYFSYYVFSKQSEITMKQMQQIIENKKNVKHLIKRLKEEHYISGPKSLFQACYKIQKKIPLWKLEEIFHENFLRESKFRISAKILDMLLSFFSFLWRINYILIPIILVCCFYAMKYDSENSPEYKEKERLRKKYGCKSDAQFYARMALKSILQSPSSVVFLNDESIERDCYETRESMKKLNIDPEKTWYVVGTFEAQNIFGVRILSVNVTVFL